MAFYSQRFSWCFSERLSETLSEKTTFVAAELMWVTLSGHELAVRKSNCTTTHITFRALLNTVLYLLRLLCPHFTRVPERDCGWEAARQKMMLNVTGL